MSSEEIPAMTFDLIVWLEDKKMSNVDVSWLVNRLDIDSRKRLLRVRYERDLKNLEE